MSTVGRAHLQVTKPSDITAADKLIFPGVGSFGQAMDVLQKQEYMKPLMDYIQVGRGGARQLVVCAQACQEAQDCRVLRVLPGAPSLA
jgi:glutamine amidotransferase/cyclase